MILEFPVQGKHQDQRRFSDPVTSESEHDDTSGQIGNVPRAYSGQAVLKRDHSRKTPTPSCLLLERLNLELLFRFQMPLPS